MRLVNRGHRTHAAAPDRHRRVDPRRAAQRPRQHATRAGERSRRAGSDDALDSATTRRSRAPGDRPALHPARPLGRLRRRHRVLRASPATARSRPTGPATGASVRRARPRSSSPDHYGQASGGGLDPCAALVDPRHAARRRLDRARLPARLRRRAPTAAARARRAGARWCRRCAALQQVRARWDELLGATAVRTPDPLFDAHGQPLAALPDDRLPALGAGRLLPGRRRLRLSRPAAGRDGARLGRARACCASRSCWRASRQFAEGDVQHWWHAPTGAGVRTHFSDDLLWLPLRLRALRRGDRRRERARRARALPRRRGDPRRRRGRLLRAGDQRARRASVYEHGARAIDRSLRVGAHGLPLMGTGDWNDGMNRVGHEGRGESVWLAWFLCDVVDRFAPIAEQRGERERAARWHDGRARLARRAAGRRLGRRVVPARLLRRRHAARLARQRRVPHRPDRAGLGGALGRRARGAGAPGDGGARARSWSTATPAWSACSTRRSRTRAERRLHPGLSARRARERRPVLARRRLGADGAGRARRRRRRLSLLHLPEPGAPLAPRRSAARPTRSSPT